MRAPSHAVTENPQSIQQQVGADVDDRTKKETSETTLPCCLIPAPDSTATVAGPLGASFPDGELYKKY